MLLLWFSAAHCLAQINQASLYVEVGQSWGINSVAISPDNRFVVTADGGGPARLWDVERGEEIRTFDPRGPDPPSYAMFLPDGRSLVTVTTGHIGSICVWDLNTGAELSSFRVYEGLRVALSPDGRKVLTDGSDGMPDNKIHLWDLATGKEERSFDGLETSLSAGWLAFSRNGRFVLAGRGHRTMVWSASTGTMVREFAGDWTQVSSIDFSPDGRYLLAPSKNSAVLLDWKTGQEVLRFDGHTNVVMCAVFSPDGKFILTGSHDKTARLWNAATGAEVSRFTGHNKVIVSAAISPSGRFVVTGSMDLTTRVWNLETGSEAKRFQSPAAQCRSVAFSPDGKFLFTANDNVARMWDLAIGGVVRSFTGHSERINSLAISHDGSMILTGSDDKTARLWDINTGAELHRFAGRSEVESVAFSPDNRLILTAEFSRARLWERETGTQVREFGKPDEDDTDSKSQAGAAASDLDEVHSVAISPDARYVLTSTSRKTVTLWDASAGQTVRRFENLAFEVNTVMASPDGSTLLMGFEDMNAGLWDMTTGSQIAEYYSTWASGSAPSVAFSPDGRYVLTTSSSDSTASLTEPRKDSPVHTLKGHQSEISSTAFSPNGRFIATSSTDHTVRLWETATGRWLATLITFGDYWAVVDPTGRFDTNNLDGGAPLHWTLSDAPLHPLPLEIFMRDYYTPRLLSLIINARSLPSLPSIAEINNRVQPDIRIEAVQLSSDSPNRADVRVSAHSKVEKAQASGLQDLRLFRDGKLVGFREGALEDGDFVFKNIQLPVSSRRAVFTAYAFNSSRIKSATVQHELSYEPQGEHRPKAFLVQIGVNHYRADNCDLHYSANDAERIGALLQSRFEARGIAVDSTQLISRDPTSIESAGKESIRRTFESIARQATPDDIFVLSFSGHGFTGKDGQYFVLPANVDGSCGNPDGTLLRNAISADELTEWLRPIDAGEMIFILDACYSAKSVEANEFRPGPMGSRGLGQLAYDKRMRILAATQSDAQALEDSRLQQGLLSYALIEEGLVQGKADWKPLDNQITLGEWLAYAVDEVPRLNVQFMGKRKARGVEIKEGDTQAQVPALFDFSKQDQFVIQKK
jgi:WD40 repeat protein